MKKPNWIGGIKMAVKKEYLEISLKNDFKEVYKAESEGAFNESIKTSLAIAAFIEKRVTLARAAELADKDLDEFIKILSRYNINWMDYTEETMEDDEQTLAELRGIHHD